MKKNMGKIDRIVRLLLGLLVAVLYFTGLISGIVAVILGLLAIIFIITSIIGFCPLYAPLKISTTGKQTG